jgi:hypothetical protein
MTQPRYSRFCCAVPSGRNTGGVVGVGVGVAVAEETVLCADVDFSAGVEQEARPTDTTNTVSALTVRRIVI